MFTGSDSLHIDGSNSISNGGIDSSFNSLNLSSSSPLQQRQQQPLPPTQQQSQYRLSSVNNHNNNNNMNNMTHIHDILRIEGIDVNDLTRGTGDWQNLQKVIRFGFKSVIDAITIQHTEIHKMGMNIETIMNNMNHDVHQKTGAIDEKSSKNTFSIHHLEKEMEKMKSHLHGLEENLTGKLNQNDKKIVHFIDNSIANSNDHLSSHMKKSSSLLETLETKSYELEKGYQKLLTRMNIFETDIEEDRKRTLIKERDHHHQNNHTSKSGLFNYDENNMLLSSPRQQQQSRQQMNHMGEEISRLGYGLDNKADRQDIDSLQLKMDSMANKASIDSLTLRVENKADKGHIDSIVNKVEALQQEVIKLNRMTENKADRSRLDKEISNISGIRSKFDVISAESVSYGDRLNEISDTVLQDNVKYQHSMKKMEDLTRSYEKLQSDMSKLHLFNETNKDNEIVLTSKLQSVTTRLNALEQQYDTSSLLLSPSRRRGNNSRNNNNNHNNSSSMSSSNIENDVDNQDTLHLFNRRLDLIENKLITADGESHTMNTKLASILNNYKQDISRMTIKLDNKIEKSDYDSYKLTVSSQFSSIVNKDDIENEILKTVENKMEANNLSLEKYFTKNCYITKEEANSMQKDIFSNSTKYKSFVERDELKQSMMNMERTLMNRIETIDNEMERTITKLDTKEDKDNNNRRDIIPYEQRRTLVEREEMKDLLNGLQREVSYKIESQLRKIESHETELQRMNSKMELKVDKAFLDTESEIGSRSGSGRRNSISAIDRNLIDRDELNHGILTVTRDLTNKIESTQKDLYKKMLIELKVNIEDQLKENEKLTKKIDNKADTEQVEKLITATKSKILNQASKWIEKDELKDSLVQLNRDIERKFEVQQEEVTRIFTKLDSKADKHLESDFNDKVEDLQRKILRRIESQEEENERLGQKLLARHGSGSGSENGVTTIADDFMTIKRGKALDFIEKDDVTHILQEQKREIQQKFDRLEQDMARITAKSDTKAEKLNVENDIKAGLSSLERDLGRRFESVEEEINRLNSKHELKADKVAVQTETASIVTTLQRDVNRRIESNIEEISKLNSKIDLKVDQTLLDNMNVEKENILNNMKRDFQRKFDSQTEEINNLGIKTEKKLDVKCDKLTFEQGESDSRASRTALSREFTQRLEMHEKEINRVHQRLESKVDITTMEIENQSISNNRTGLGGSYVKDSTFVDSHKGDFVERQEFRDAMNKAFSFQRNFVDKIQMKEALDSFQKSIEAKKFIDKDTANETYVDKNTLKDALHGSLNELQNSVVDKAELSNALNSLQRELTHRCDNRDQEIKDIYFKLEGKAEQSLIENELMLGAKQMSSIQRPYVSREEMRDALGGLRDAVTNLQREITRRLDSQDERHNTLALKTENKSNRQETVEHFGQMKKDLINRLEKSETELNQLMIKVASITNSTTLGSLGASDFTVTEREAFVRRDALIEALGSLQSTMNSKFKDEMNRELKKVLSAVKDVFITSEDFTESMADFHSRYISKDDYKCHQKVEASRIEEFQENIDDFKEHLLKFRGKDLLEAQVTDLEQKLNIVDASNNQYRKRMGSYEEKLQTMAMQLEILKKSTLENIHSSISNAPSIFDVDHNGLAGPPHPINGMYPHPLGGIQPPHPPGPPGTNGIFADAHTAAVAHAAHAITIGGKTVEQNIKSLNKKISKRDTDNEGFREVILKRVGMLEECSILSDMTKENLNKLEARVDSINQYLNEKQGEITNEEMVQNFYSLQQEVREDRTKFEFLRTEEGFREMLLGRLSTLESLCEHVNNVMSPDKLQLTINQGLRDVEDSVLKKITDKNEDNEKSYHEILSKFDTVLESKGQHVDDVLHRIQITVSEAMSAMERDIYKEISRRDAADQTFRDSISKQLVDTESNFNTSNSEFKTKIDEFDNEISATKKNQSLVVNAFRNLETDIFDQFQVLEKDDSIFRAFVKKRMDEWIEREKEMKINSSKKKEEDDDNIEKQQNELAKAAAQHASNIVATPLSTSIAKNEVQIEELKSLQEALKNRFDELETSVQEIEWRKHQQYEQQLLLEKQQRQQQQELQIQLGSANSNNNSSNELIAFKLERLETDMSQFLDIKLKIERLEGDTKRIDNDFKYFNDTQFKKMEIDYEQHDTILRRLEKFEGEMNYFKEVEEKQTLQTMENISGLETEMMVRLSDLEGRYSSCETFIRDVQLATIESRDEFRHLFRSKETETAKTIEIMRVIENKISSKNEKLEELLNGTRNEFENKQTESQAKQKQLEENVNNIFINNNTIYEKMATDISKIEDHIIDIQKQIKKKLNALKEKIDAGSTNLHHTIKTEIKTEMNSSIQVVADNLDKTKEEILNILGDELNKTRIELNKVTNNLNETKNDLNGTTSDLNETTNNLDKTGADLNKTKDELKKTRDELNKTTNDLHKTANDLHKTREDIFTLTDQNYKELLEIIGEKSDLLEKSVINNRDHVDVRVAAVESDTMSLVNDVRDIRIAMVPLELQLQIHQPPSPTPPRSLQQQQQQQQQQKSPVHQELLQAQEQLKQLQELHQKLQQQQDQQEEKEREEKQKSEREKELQEQQEQLEKERLYSEQQQKIEQQQKLLEQQHQLLLEQSQEQRQTTHQQLHHQQKQQQQQQQESTDAIHEKGRTENYYTNHSNNQSYNNLDSHYEYSHSRPRPHPHPQSYPQSHFHADPYSANHRFPTMNSHASTTSQISAENRSIAESKRLENLRKEKEALRKKISDELGQK